MFFQVLNENIVLFIFMIIGFILSKYKVLSQIQIDGLSKLLTYVALPSACFISLQTESSPTLLKKVAVTLILSIVLVLGLYLFGIALTKIFQIRMMEQKVWLGCLTFSNILFIGIPLIGAVYGTEGILMLVSYNTVSMFLLFTLGIVIYSKKGKESVKLKDFFLNPAIILTFLGFIFFFCNYIVPKPIYNAVNSLGSLTAPVSMIVAGAMMAKNNIIAFLLDYKVYLFSVIRLLVVPIITFFVLSSFITDPFIIGVLVITTAMPAGAMNVVFAEEYGSSGDIASKYIVMTTLLSIITLPLISLLL